MTQLSVPVFRLKRNARLRARAQKIPLHQALDQIAAEEGFRAWSELSAKYTTRQTSQQLAGMLKPGELMVFAARPGQGKTRFALEVLVSSLNGQRPGFFFTLEYLPTDFVELLADLNVEQRLYEDQLTLDTSDEICAPYVIRKVQEGLGPLEESKRQRNPVIAIDYLQLLDQKRSNPPLADQLAMLKEFATQHRASIIVISQIDREFELSGRDMPTLSDLRCPNPFDPSIFDKTCFLHNGEMVVGAATGG